MKIIKGEPFTDRNLFASEAEWLEEEERLLKEKYPDIIIEVPYTEETKDLFRGPDWADWDELERRLDEELKRKIRRRRQKIIRREKGWRKRKIIKKERASYYF